MKNVSLFPMQSDPRGTVPLVHPKRVFLKKGKGLLRFTSQKVSNQHSRPLPPAKAIIRSYSEPISLQQVQTGCAQKLPVQRKTATVCKDFPQTSSFRQDTKTVRLKMLQSHLRLHVPPSGPVQGLSEEQAYTQPAEPTALKAPCGGNIPRVNRPQDEIPKAVSSTQPGQVQSIQRLEPSAQGQGKASDSLEKSFQERLLHWESTQQKESVELGEFELLEQAAEELSFSSNSSFVLKVLQMDQQRPLQQRRLSSTPIKSPPDHPEVPSRKRVISSLSNSGNAALSCHVPSWWYWESPVLSEAVYGLKFNYSQYFFPTAPQAQSQLLRDRLVELEVQIERFKKENATLTKVRKDNQKLQEDLRRERFDFEQMKAQEMTRFEEYKREENRKLQRERKLLEKHMSAARAIPNKSERQEIQGLKQQLSSLQEELKRKESRWANTHSRLRHQLQALGQDNSTLRDEVKTLEKLRLTAWKKNSTDSDKSSLVMVTLSSGKSQWANTDIFRRSDMVTLPQQVEQLLSSGARLMVFPNGTKKEVSPDGRIVKVIFFNGDTKELTDDQRVIYFYAEAKTTHITYPDGMEVLHFPNNQTEKHFPDGHKEITFPDHTVKTLYPNGREESVLTDGTIIQVHPDGSKEIHFNTGQKEVHTAEYKRREYPDGTVKTVYSDGRQETRYPTGRLRIKDREGNVILDNRA
uniref:Centromere protein J C-terminal domain-containing protein n=1 Tax=Neogobius melanostomus TaxID=47308 RepID=A0A8C6TRI6_9GOBI